MCINKQEAEKLIKILEAFLDDKIISYPFGFCNDGKAIYKQVNDEEHIYLSPDNHSLFYLSLFRID